MPKKDGAVAFVSRSLDN